MRRGVVVTGVAGAATLAVVAVAAAAFGLPGSDDAPAEPRETASAAPTPEPDPAWQPTDDEFAAAREIVAGLSDADLAGQLIVARHFDEASSLALVRERHFAGVMVTTQHILDVASDEPLAEVTRFNDDLRAAGEERGAPVLVPIDQEGGLVARLGAPMTEFASFMTAGAALAGDAVDGSTRGADAVRSAARGSGEELRAAGYNAVFAPVGDLTIGAADPVIGSRSPGSDPDAAAGAVGAAVRGYGEAGILSSVKHFPGHRVDEDSHKGLPRLEASRSELESTDLVPFEAAVDVTAPMIMTGHLDVPALTDGTADDGVPASMSREVVTGLLRDELGYDGLVVSDSLGMGPIMKRYPGGEAAVQTLKAGSDLALMPADNVAAHDAVTEAIESGDLPREQAEASAVRVLAWTMHADAAPVPDAEPGSRAGTARDLSAAGLTVVTRDCDQDFAVRSVTPIGDPATVQRFTEVARDAGLTIGGGTVVSFGASSLAPATVAVALDTPYVLASTDAPYRIALYDDAEPALRALVDVLTGKAEAHGALTVEVDGLEPTRC